MHSKNCFPTHITMCIALEFKDVKQTNFSYMTSKLFVIDNQPDLGEGPGGRGGEGRRGGETAHWHQLRVVAVQL